MRAIPAAPTLPEVATWMNASLWGRVFAGNNRWRWALTDGLPTFHVMLGLLAAQSPSFWRRCHNGCVWALFWAGRCWCWRCSLNHHSCAKRLLRCHSCAGASGRAPLHQRLQHGETICVLVNIFLEQPLHSPQSNITAIHDDSCSFLQAYCRANCLKHAPLGAVKAAENWSAHQQFPCHCPGRPNV